MDRLVESHLRSFVKEHGLENIELSNQFEKFVNFSLLSNRLVDIDLDEVTTGEGDDGIDGVAVIINEEYVTSAEDAKRIFSIAKRNNDVEIVFIQSKISEGFDLGDFLKFKESVLRFLSPGKYEVSDFVQCEARAAFDVVIDNVNKIRNGQPNLSAFYVTTGKYSAPSALEDARDNMINKINELGLFENVDVRFMGREELIQAWVDSYSAIEAKLKMFSSAPLPSISGVEEAYLVIVKAKDYIENLLTNDDGSIRGQLFYENVRHFLGGDNPVNAQIAQTLLDPEERTRFPVLNNGVTIVSPDVKLQGTMLHIANFQIVNGCQTSHVLYENRNNITDDVMVSLKVVETADENVFSSLVKATNNQSKIENSQFLSLSPIAKKVEDYFNTYENKEARLYFERRDRQYVGREEIPEIRVVSLHVAAKCVCAMFLRRPDLSFKFPKKMYEEFGKKIFEEDNKEVIYYAAALAFYRFRLLTANGLIAQDASRFKWHILPLIAVLISGEKVPALNSKGMEKYCQKIIEMCSTHNQKVIDVFREAVNIINSISNLTNDRLKGQAVLDEIFSKLKTSS